MRLVARDARACASTEHEWLDGESRDALGTQLSDAIDRLERVTGTLLSASATAEPSRALANASAYLDLVSRTVVAWLWLRQALVAASALTKVTLSGVSRPTDEAFYRGKVQAARYWFGWELPRTEQLAELLERADATPFDMQDAWF